jgi:membrane fusion protein (multidrug efflux system)
MPQSATDMLRLQRRLAEGSLHAHGTGAGNVQVVLEDGTTYGHPGTLEFRDVSVDPTTGSVMLRALFPNPQGQLLPDLFVRGIVTEGVDRDAVLIPQQAVARNAKGEPYCWIVDDQSQAQIRPLTVDRAVDARWLVSSGLQGGETLIVEGLQYLRRSGTPVQTQAYSPEGQNPSSGQSAESHQAD